MTFGFSFGVGFGALGALAACEEVETAAGALGALGACEVFVTVTDDFLAAEDPVAGVGAVRLRVLGRDERNDFSLAYAAWAAVISVLLLSCLSISLAEATAWALGLLLLALAPGRCETVEATEAPGAILETVIPDNC